MFLKYKEKEKVNDYVRSLDMHYYVYDANSFFEEYINSLPKVLYNYPVYDEEDYHFETILGIKDLSLTPYDIHSKLLENISTNFSDYSVKSYL